MSSLQFGQRQRTLRLRLNHHLDLLAVHAFGVRFDDVRNPLCRDLRRTQRFKPAVVDTVVGSNHHLDLAQPPLGPPPVEPGGVDELGSGYLSIGRDVAAARHLGGPSLCLGLERLVFFVHLVKAAADDGNRQAEHLQRYKSAAGTTCIHS